MDDVAHSCIINKSIASRGLTSVPIFLSVSFSEGSKLSDLSLLSLLSVEIQATLHRLHPVAPRHCPHLVSHCGAKEFGITISRYDLEELFSLFTAPMLQAIKLP